MRIPIPDEVTPGTTRPVITTESQSSRSVEILKSIVYGGLMESLASLSVVSSAAASEATTCESLTLLVLFSRFIIVFCPWLTSFLPYYLAFEYL